MNLKAIRLFLRVIESGSLAKAAHELHMSQSAASRLLSQFERTAGIDLFDRHGHRLKPTSQGIKYFKECHRALAAIDELPHAAKRLSKGVQTRLRIVSLLRFAPGLVVPAIARFLNRHPQIEIDLQLVWRPEIEQVLSDLSFDVGIVSLPLKNSACETTPLCDLPVMAVVARRHVLASKKRISMSDLKAHRLVVPVIGRPYDEIIEMFATEGIEFRPQITTGTIDLACQFVLRANAVTVADPLVPLTLNPKAFSLIPIKPPRIVSVGLMVPVSKPLSSEAKELAECLRTEARALEGRLSLKSAGHKHRKKR